MKVLSYEMCDIGSLYVGVRALMIAKMDASVLCMCRAS